MYLLLIEDDQYGYVWLKICTTVDSDKASQPVGEWIAAFRGMEYLVSDHGAHFMAGLMEKLMNEAPAWHHFTTSFCP